MILSFIIPVYNTAPYLERCVLSITSQLGEKEGLYEIIIVNDGSTDNSSEIINSLEATYPSIITVITQNNQGLGAARNAGQRLSRGKYIFYVDSDDYINKDSLSELMLIAKVSQDEIIGFGVIEIDEFQRRKYIKKEGKKETLSGSDFLLKNNIAGGVWNYIFSRQFLLKTNLWMPEGIYHEDELFLIKSLLCASSVKIIDLYIYIYERRASSITKTKDMRVKDKKIKDSLFILEEFIELKHNFFTSNKQQIALDRKIKFFSHDIVINLISLKIPKRQIYATIQRLKELEYFPLPDIQNSWKHNFFKRLVCNRYLIGAYSKISFIRNYLSRI